MPLHLRLMLPALCLATGFALGYIQLPGLAAGTILCALLLFADRYLPTALWAGLSLLACIGFAAHLVPGFSAIPLWPPRQLSADAAPYALRLSWDKLLVGVTLLAWWLGQKTPSKPLSNSVWLTAALTLLVVPLLALALGLVGWQPKWPDELWLWLAVNLGVAVLAEELLFRGLLQSRLVSWLGAGAGIGLTTLLFAAVHLPFSPLFAVVAGIAGLGYGLIFHFSGRISLAIALHGAVNLLHLLVLSYPLRVA
ncbi:CPBP family intramembrane metalloprotease [Pseudomonas sp. HMWF032]|uniref:CPBP family intramembrane glutamic endopeptidase n=1 Tax=Pseudomonas sp. HMWF032 TaxID=2056866 RepID=UPI000D3C7C6D|nr:CPBP family intramembrane glutamic endopeptidase [Pseudomonas sp. HMWF032]PTS84072.1 CPBP family intramembrane metalloprotease [Pseudomonas sp. HMWF032]PTT85427.1 CPBP family intramembrane metalloprotease [Pseudomonas sp. HMWF010]